MSRNSFSYPYHVYEILCIGLVTPCIRRRIGFLMTSTQINLTQNHELQSHFFPVLSIIIYPLSTDLVMWSKPDVIFLVFVRHRSRNAVIMPALQMNVRRVSLSSFF